MPLKLKRKKGSRNWYIRGTVRGQYVEESTGTDQRGPAEDLRIKREAELLDRSIHGPSKTATFAEAVVGYLTRGGAAQYLDPLLNRFGLINLSMIDQQAIDTAALELYPDASNDTRNRQVYTPTIAVLNDAAAQKLCAWQRFKRPKLAKGRVRFLEPKDAERLIAAAPDKLRPLMIFLFYTGCRIGEAVSLDWAFVNLTKRHAAIVTGSSGRKLAEIEAGPVDQVATKNEDARGVRLHDRVLVALANLPHRKGLVFGYNTRWLVYDDWATALKAAKIKNFTPHDCRHTWATWMRRFGGLDLPGLVATGAWKDMKSVERYAHVAASEVQSALDKLPNEETPHPSKAAGSVAKK